MAFGKHPSVELQKIFSQRPFQIQEPEKAKIIFLGLDANWDENIEDNQKYYFEENLKYLKDGVEYWESHKYYTPMLEDFYKGAGKKYHKVFSKLGFTKENARDICFLELLSVCTFGNSQENIRLFNNMLFDRINKDHLDRIKRLSKNKNIKICIPRGVRTIIDKLGLFNTNNENIIIHTHFSNAISNKELDGLKIKLHEFIN